MDRTESNDQSNSNRTWLHNESFSTSRMSRTVLANSTTRHTSRLFTNRTVANSPVTVSTLFQHFKPRRFRSKLERLNHTRNFYSRRGAHPSSDASPALVRRHTATTGSNHNKSTTYRPSFKVEKLLNDSRGMKKYLIDYDCLFQPIGHKANVKTVDLTGRPDDDVASLPGSNRCSSGYLSDC